MASASMSSPLCKTCIFVSREKDETLRSPIFRSLEKMSRTTRPEKLVSKCSNNIRGASRDLFSLFRPGSGFQNFMSPSLSFEQCKKFYCSGRFSSSSAFFGDNVFSRSGSKAAPMTPRQKHKNGSSMAVAVQPEKQVIMKKKPSTKRRVVVTGLGVVTSIGDDVDVFYHNLLAGVSGISEIESFDCAEFRTRIGGEIKSFSPDGWVSPKLSKRADKFTLYLITAGKKALEDGGITEDVNGELDKTKCGIVIGSSLGGVKVFHDGIDALRVSYKKMNPFCVPFSTTNMGPALLAIDLGWMGTNYSISSACATSNVCILNSANHIIRGDTDLMLCGGSDAAITPVGLGGFLACRALSQRNNDPTKASRPWDSDRDGFVLGEGAGVLLLEELEHAKKRGAKIYAEFLGGSFTSDAYRIAEPHPDGKGAALCIEQALAGCGVAREDVNYINAHAASTQKGDLCEYQALVRCFGRNPELRVNSTKSMTGHVQGASGAVEAVATIKAIQTGWLHPNINLENPDKAVDMNLLIGGEKERMDIKVALSNSFGFGGHNSSILFAPYK